MVEIASIRAPLFVPADRPERFAKAAASGADTVTFDLGGAVAAGATDAVRAALATDFTDLQVIMRINAAGMRRTGGGAAAACRGGHAAENGRPGGSSPLRATRVSSTASVSTGCAPISRPRTSAMRTWWSGCGP